MELENLNFDELNPSEALLIDGGYWRVIYDAVRGGLIYDGIKAGMNYLIENPNGLKYYSHGTYPSCFK